MTALNELVGQPAEVRMVVQVTRKATGLTETVELIGRTTVEQAEALGIKKEDEHVHDTQHGRA